MKRPAKRAKNEYHRRVSPIVLKGGLSSPVQRQIMKAARAANDADANDTAIVLRRRYLSDDCDQWSLAHIETTAPAAERSTEGIPNHIKLSHVIISVILPISSLRTACKKQEGSGQHHNDSDKRGIFPRLFHDLNDAVLRVAARHGIVSGKVYVFSE